MFYLHSKVFIIVLPDLPCAVTLKLLSLDILVTEAFILLMPQEYTSWLMKGVYETPDMWNYIPLIIEPEHCESSVDHHHVVLPLVLVVLYKEMRQSTGWAVAQGLFSPSSTVYNHQQQLEKLLAWWYQFWVLMMSLCTLSYMMKFSLQVQNNWPKKDTDGCTQHILHSTPLVVGLLLLLLRGISDPFVFVKWKWNLHFN